jgi:undecaprenyl-diphosphatase
LIDELLESPVTVAVSLLLGGIVLLKDQWFNHSEDTKITYLTAFKIDYTNVLYGSWFLSGASIVWNVSKLTRTSAAEFSFFLLSYYVWRNGKKMLRLLQRWFCIDS